MAFVRALTEALEALGIDRHTLLRGSAFTADDLSTPLKPIEHAQLDALVERAIALTGEPALGLRWWQEATFGAFGAVGHALLVAPSFRAGLALMERYWPLFMSEPLIELEDDGVSCSVRLQRKSNTPLAHRAYVESGMFVLARFLRQCAGVDGVPRVARFDYPEPDYAAHYTAALGCACEFGACRAELVLDSAHVHRPNLNHAEALSRDLCSIADGLLAQQAVSPLSVRVLELWRGSAEIARMTMEETAAQLGMSERTLRRRLHIEGTSFPALVQRALGELAARLLRDPARSVKEVALTLGFTEPSAFHRALRRWTGKTPGELRTAEWSGSDAPSPRRGKDESGPVRIERPRRAD
jgi:AraC-like DNA-binding protein